jgi:signal transduction histidine kinase
MPQTIDIKKITEQLYIKNLELLDQRKRTEELLYNISEIVITIDKEFKITFANKTTQKILDLKGHKDIIGKDINEIIKVKHGDKYFNTKEYCFDNSKTGHRIKNLILETPNKNKIMYVTLTTFTVTYETSKNTECLITITDITEEKMLGKMKDEFLSLAAHELRTPITIIKGYLWLLSQEKAGKLNAEQKNYIQTVINSAENMHNLVNDMLNISTIEQGKTTFKIEKLDILQELKANVEGLQIKAKEKNIYLEIKCDEKDSYETFADKTKLVEVFLNLVGNSIKFTKLGGITVLLEKIDNKFVKVSITDTGIGISKEDQPKLFNKFGRIDSSYQTVAEIQGTGLGLYITKQYIEKMGGTIGMESEGVGKGSTFWFMLPIDNLNKRK